MKYSHTGLESIKSGIGTRLSMVIAKLNVSLTMKEIASTIGCSIGVINNIKNHCGDKTSLQLLLFIADKLDINYELVIKSHNGIKTQCCNMDGISDVANYNKYINSSSENRGLRIN